METLKLPVSNFTWLTKKEVRRMSSEDILSLPAQADIGYAFEVDMRYPNHLHKVIIYTDNKKLLDYFNDNFFIILQQHDQFPLAPYTGNLTFDDLSPFNKRLLQQQCPSDFANRRYKSTKLLSTFYHRKKYVVHLENLQYYLKKGLRLTKVHRAIKFQQKPILKKFIEKVTNLRSKAKNDFELRLFKLFANSTFGKFIENVRNYIEVQLCSSEESFRRVCLGQHVKNFYIINKNLVSVMKKPRELKMNKPLAVGFAILELSKLFMYRSFYDVFVPHFGTKNISLCFSDTDSFLFQVKTNNLLNDMKKLEHLFDFSKYPKNHVLYSRSKANHLFYFKDELCGKAAITHFIGLRPKCYSMKIKNYDDNDTKTKKVCKGIKRVAIKNRLSFADYQKCLDSQCIIYKSFRNLGSKNHRISTKFVRKIALSAIDTKRYILNCGKHTLALGNCKIKKCTIAGTCYICQ